jgi:hypothetical protein
MKSTIRFMNSFTHGLVSYLLLSGSMPFERLLLTA